MIPLEKTIRALQEELTQLKKSDLDTGYSQGIRQGLRLAIALVREIGVQYGQKKRSLPCVK